MPDGFGWLFPGQGSQFVGMGQDLAAGSPVASDVFSQADATLDIEVSALCWEGPEQELASTRNQQPALLTVCIAMLRELLERQLAPPPDFVAGHSLGEYTALVASGSLQFGDAIRLVRRRGELMEQYAQGGMIAVIGLDEEAVGLVANDSQTEIANHNSPGQTTLSGTEEALAVAEMAANVRGAKRVVRLPVNAAFHSSLMEPVSIELAADIERIDVLPSRYPLVSNVNAEPLTHPDDLRQELIDQIYLPVQWTRVMDYMINDGMNQAIEIGPGNVLTGLARRIDRSLQVRTATQLLDE